MPAGLNSVNFCCTLSTMARNDSPWPQMKRIRGGACVFGWMRPSCVDRIGQRAHVLHGCRPAAAEARRVEEQLERQRAASGRGRTAGSASRCRGWRSRRSARPWRCVYSGGLNCTGITAGRLGPRSRRVHFDDGRHRHLSTPRRAACDACRRERRGGAGALRVARALLEPGDDQRDELLDLRPASAPDRRRCTETSLVIFSMCTACAHLLRSSPWWASSRVSTARLFCSATSSGPIHFTGNASTSWNSMTSSLPDGSWTRIDAVARLEVAGARSRRTSPTAPC